MPHTFAEWLAVLAVAAIGLVTALWTREHPMINSWQAISFYAAIILISFAALFQQRRAEAARLRAAADEENTRRQQAAARIAAEKADEQAKNAEHEQERQVQALEARKAKDAEREAFLAERIQCKGGCPDAWQPRRSFYEIDVWGGPKSMTPPYVCANCYQRIKRESPHGNPRTKKAF
jgi:hypothetical protein